MGWENINWGMGQDNVPKHLVVKTTPGHCPKMGQTCEKGHRGAGQGGISRTLGSIEGDQSLS